MLFKTTSQTSFPFRASAKVHKLLCISYCNRKILEPSQHFDKSFILINHYTIKSLITGHGRLLHTTQKMFTPPQRTKQRRWQSLYHINTTWTCWHFKLNGALLSQKTKRIQTLTSSAVHTSRLTVCINSMNVNKGEVQSGRQDQDIDGYCDNIVTVNFCLINHIGILVYFTQIWKKKNTESKFSSSFGWGETSGLKKVWASN